MFEIFKSYQFNQEKAHAFGFVENSGVWTYSCQILQGDFVMIVSITADKKLDKANLEKLIAASKGMEIVFHMAFDELSDEDQLEAIDWLSQAGVTRILTRAGVSGDSLEKRFAHYHRILEYAKGKIEILPGGGIDLDNRQTFIDQLGVTQLHGTKVVF